jgi:hypothetical protein
VSAKHRSTLYDFLTESERNVRLNFTRIYPAPNSDYYDRFFDGERPNNKLIYKYLFLKNDLTSLIEQSKFTDPTPEVDSLACLRTRVGVDNKSNGSSPGSPTIHRFRNVPNLTMSSQL